MSKMLGISVERLCELERLGKVRKEAKDRWNPEKVREDLRNNLDQRQPLNAATTAARSESQPGAEPGPTPGTLNYEHYRLTKAKAEIAEYERLELMRELIRGSEVEQRWSEVITTVKSRILAVPDEICDKIAVESSPIRCRELIKSALWGALSEVAGARHAA